MAGNTLRFKRISASLLLILTWSTCCASISIALEEQLEQLVNQKYAEMENAFAIKTSKLEATVTQLMEKVSDLESKASEEHQIKNSARASLLRTCRESRMADPTLTSGMYWIDPDGVGVGDEPIYVFCNMDTGSTFVLHDTESQTDVGHCSEPGCYSKTINYEATLKQMRALIGLSSQCQQSIRYDCISAPLEINGIKYSWWEDRNGNAQYFWTGDYPPGVHICTCGVDSSCVEKQVPCNCDSSLQAPLSDSGVITAKNILPITKLNFGRTTLQTSSGSHTLGRLECTGVIPVIGKPTSCADLWQIGHVYSGFYSVVGAERIETVYCDFVKLPEDPGFQTWIGFVDIKTTSTYFYVQKSTPFSTTNVAIPFEVEKLNVGNAMNAGTGTFTAPRKGTYFFSFSGAAYFSSATSGYLNLALMLNGDPVGEGDADSRSGDRELETLSIQSLLDLNEGDQVWVSITGLANAVVQDSEKHVSHFTGWIVTEDISLTP